MKHKHIYSYSQRLLVRLKKKGLKKTFLSIFSYAYDLFFDAKYNLDTHSWVSVDELDIEDGKKENAVLYQATRVLALRKLFKKLEFPNEFTLVDIGSGKGRVLLIASEFGFDDVIGIEISPTLCSIAENNILEYRFKTQTRTYFHVVNADASEYQYNDDEDVFFLYNPFDDIILEKVLNNISASLKRRNRKAWMIYANAVHRELIEKTMKIVNTEDYNILDFEFVVYEIEYL